MKPSILVMQETLFEPALKAWAESRRPFISPRTYKDWQYYIRTMTPFFRDFHLTEIDGDLLRAYQTMRMARGVGAIAINL